MAGQLMQRSNAVFVYNIQVIFNSNFLKDKLFGVRTQATFHCKIKKLPNMCFC